MVRDLERRQLENWLQRNPGKTYVDSPLWIGKQTWRYLCPLWMLTTGWPQQRRILMIKWMEWSVQSAFSPATLVITKQSGQGSRDRGCAWGQQRTLLVTKADLDRAAAKSPTYQQQRPTVSPWYGTHPHGDQPATWGQVDYIGPPLSRKGQCVVLIGRDIYCGYGYSFPARMLLPKTPSR